MVVVLVVLVLRVILVEVVTIKWLVIFVVRDKIYLFKGRGMVFRIKQIYTKKHAVLLIFNAYVFPDKVQL